MSKFCCHKWPNIEQIIQPSGHTAAKTLILNLFYDVSKNHCLFSHQSHLTSAVGSSMLMDLPPYKLETTTGSIVV